MGRTRQIKYEFFLNERLAAIEPLARLLFIGLWTICDKEGRLEYRPARIKAQLFPYHDAHIEAMVGALSGFLMVYEVDGHQYIQIRKFETHQRTHPGEKLSVIPKFGSGCREIKLDLIASNEICPTSTSTSKPTSTLSAAPKELEVKIPKPKTPTQRVVEAYKHAKGVPMDDKAWDKASFGRYSKAAKSLLACFGDDVDKCAAYLFVRAEDLNEKGLDWTLETIARHAYDGMGMPKENHGLGNQPLGSDSVLGQRSTRRIASSGSLVGEALRGLEHAAIHPEGDGDMGGFRDDSAGD